MKKTIGFTCSSFDLLHAGHILMLKDAKEQCDYLIVGLQTDPTLDRPEKNKPIQSFEERKIQLEAVKYVDEVIAQSHRDKMKSFSEIGFDIMFVGSDWKGSNLFTSIEKELEKHNAKVHYFNYSEGISSSRLRRILAAENKK